MSAGERLRKLDAEWNRLDGSYSATAARRVMEALPQLIAVVEASHHAWQVFPLEPTGIQKLAKDELGVALAALEEALER